MTSKQIKFAAHKNGDVDSECKRGLSIAKDVFYLLPETLLKS